MIEKRQTKHVLSSTGMIRVIQLQGSVACSPAYVDMTRTSTWTTSVFSAWKTCRQREGPLLHLVSYWPWYTQTQSGVGQRRFLIPDIGIRALQGHSRDDVGPEVLTSAHEELFYRTNRLPEYSAHGTSIKAWAELITGTRCLKRGGPKRVRQAAHFAVSLPGNTRRIVSGFRAGSRIYILLDLRAWLRHEGHLTVPPKTPSAFMQTFP